MIFILQLPYLFIKIMLSCNDIDFARWVCYCFCIEIGKWKFKKEKTKRYR